LAAFGQAAVAPAWLRPALQAVHDGVARAGPRPVAAVLVLLELALGTALLAGWRVRGAIALGLGYSLLCWVVLDALGYPYGRGQTDPGVFINYALAFAFAWRAQAVLAGAAPGPDPFRRERLLFGLLWALDAALKWQPGFLTQFMAQLTPAAVGQPAPIAAYIHAVVALVGWIGPLRVAVLTALAETLVAASLLSGRAMRWSVPLAALYCLAVWTSAEGFGGPYGLAGTGVRGDVIGNVLIYVYLFAYLWPVAARPQSGAAPGSGGGG
ncbi:MAG: hypothetical protein KGK09_08350, partial [Burkholderiales bacterium]|nr:hypothetical protein [Burkholderiales bacterium]